MKNLDNIQPIINDNRINLESFNINHMLAKLLIIQRDYENKDILIQGKESVLDFCKIKIKENFIYKETNENYLIQHLALFLLGNTNNSFNKLIDNIA